VSHRSGVRPQRSATRRASSSEEEILDGMFGNQFQFLKNLLESLK
jgi:hypothetical protein